MIESITSRVNLIGSALLSITLPKFEKSNVVDFESLREDIFNGFYEGYMEIFENMKSVSPITLLIGWDDENKKLNVLPLVEPSVLLSLGYKEDSDNFIKHAVTDILPEFGLKGVLILVDGFLYREEYNTDKSSVENVLTAICSFSDMSVIHKFRQYKQLGGKVQWEDPMPISLIDDVPQSNITNYF